MRFQNRITRLGDFQRGLPLRGGSYGFGWDVLVLKLILLHQRDEAVNEFRLPLGVRFFEKPF